MSHLPPLVSDSIDKRRGPVIRISNKFPGDADAIGPNHTLRITATDVHLFLINTTTSYSCLSMPYAFKL